jgi:hypothetical protein
VVHSVVQEVAHHLQQAVCIAVGEHPVRGIEGYRPLRIDRASGVSDGVRGHAARSVS